MKCVLNAAACLLSGRVHCIDYVETNISAVCGGINKSCYICQY